MASRQSKHSQAASSSPRKTYTKDYLELAADQPSALKYDYPCIDDRTARCHGDAQPGLSNLAQSYSPYLSISTGHHADGDLHHSLSSDGEISIDPSIAQPSPTDLSSPQYYFQHAPQNHLLQSQGQIMHWGPEWADQQFSWSTQYGDPVSTAPVLTTHSISRPLASGDPRWKAHTFVPLSYEEKPKRPRRRPEEIERKYGCGWRGCKKAYGTPNHLNAHVKTQSHGQKRTPEDLKKMREKWSAEKWKATRQKTTTPLNRKAQDGHQATLAPLAPYGQQYTTPRQISGLQLSPINSQTVDGEAPDRHAQLQFVDSGQKYAGSNLIYGAQHYPQGSYSQASLLYRPHK